MSGTTKYRYYEKKEKTWTESTVTKALRDIKESGLSIRAAGRRYGISEAKLRTSQKHVEDPSLSGRGYQGRQPVLSREVEVDIAALIRAFARAGMGIRKFEVGDIIQEFCESHEIEAWTDGIPGKKYIAQFCDRHNLTMRKEVLLSVSREEATSNPFVIMDFYDRLADCVQQIRDQGVNEEDLPKHIYNCDETSFPYDPTPVRVIGGSGERTTGSRVGEGRKNTTVLACAGASGDVLPPMVIFNLYNRPSEATLDGCMEGMTMEVSKKGWMTKQLFQSWFKTFCQQVDARPLLLLLDGCSSHVSVNVLETAMDAGIILLKLPPHTTDLLQPLDVVPFARLKAAWTEKLRKWTHENRAVAQPSRREFCLFISDLWADHFTPEIIVAAFDACGVWEVDPEKYPKARFNDSLYQKYLKWVGLGKPELTDEEYIQFITALSPKKAAPRSRSRSVSKDRTPSPDRPSTSTAHSVPSCRDVSAGTFPAKPDTQPVPGYPCPGPGFVAEWQPSWVPIWVRNTDVRSTLVTPEQKTDAATKAILARKFGETPKPKKRKRAEVISSPEFLQLQRKREENAAIREQKAAIRQASQSRKMQKQPAKRTAQRKKETSESSASTDEDQTLDLSSDSARDYPPHNAFHTRRHLEKLWRSLNPPTEEDTLKGGWYALVYYKDDARKKPTLLIGRLVRRFLDDQDGLPANIEFDCLEPNPLPGSMFKEPVKQDLDIFRPWDVIDGPLRVEYMKNKQYRVDDYDDVRTVFGIAKEIRREHLAISSGLASVPIPQQGGAAAVGDSGGGQ